MQIKQQLATISIVRMTVIVSSCECEHDEAPVNRSYPCFIVISLSYYRCFKIKIYSNDWCRVIPRVIACFFFKKSRKFSINVPHNMEGFSKLKIKMDSENDSVSVLLYQNKSLVEQVKKYLYLFGKNKQNIQRNGRRTKCIAVASELHFIDDAIYRINLYHKQPIHKNYRCFKNKKLQVKLFVVHS